MAIDLTIIDTLEELENELEINDDSIDDELYMDFETEEIYSRFIYKPQELNAITLLNK